jgi:hypothetical protein
MKEDPSLRALREINTGLGSQRLGLTEGKRSQ